MAITSRGGYTEIAKVLREAREEAIEVAPNARLGVDLVHRKLAELFKKDNPRFDTQRFYEGSVGTIIPNEESRDDGTIKHS